MANPHTPPPAAPASGPETTLRETVYSVSVDAAELAGQLPGDDTSARMLDRLSEELAEAAAMFRSLPGRPVEARGHDWQLLAALRTAHMAGEDVRETIARALARLAAEVGGSFEVIKARPGSSEAALIAELLRGMVGPDDENLPVFGGPGGSL
jgi:hypothetical protein